MTIQLAILSAWLIIGFAHFGIPVTYFLFMRGVQRKSYRLNIVPNSSYQPHVTILVPTYNEEKVIAGKLENISDTDYPKQKLEVLVVDSGSTDNTVEEARHFFKNGTLRGRVLEEGERRGKAAGLNIGLKHASGELVCISDAECSWDNQALANSVKYFADPSVGSVSGVHGSPRGSNDSVSSRIEQSYRSVYRMLRIAESKLDSTPIGEGELQLLRRGQLAGFDPNIGGDDTCAALCLVEEGLRAISAEDVVFYDPTPGKWNVRLSQKIRRGQHVYQAFMKHRNLLFGKPTKFSRLIFPMEFYLYIVNPLLFPVFLALTVGLALVNTVLAITIAVLLLVTLLVPSLSKAASTMLTNNLTMLGALLLQLRGRKQLVWRKIEENRNVEPLELTVGSPATQQNDGSARSTRE